MSNLEQEAFEYAPEMEAAYEHEFHEAEYEHEFGHEAEVFSEAELHELTAELLEVGSEAELDLFLGNLIKKAGQAVGSFVRSPIGKSIGGFLKGVAKKALPIAGTALGGFVGGPIGAKIGQGLGSVIGGALETEHEFSQEDREFEGAKRFVRLAGSAVNRAVKAPRGANPVAVARSAVTGATRAYVPGLLDGAYAADAFGGGYGGACGGNGGRWVRQGRNIILVNAL
jgi:hypothetical protein